MEVQQCFFFLQHAVCELRKDFAVGAGKVISKCAGRNEEALVDDGLGGVNQECICKL